MKKHDTALAILAKIRDLLDNEEYGYGSPDEHKQFEDLLRMLKMQTSGFLQNDTQSIYLKEQIGNLNGYKDDLCSADKPRFWQTHDRCKADLIKSCMIARGLIERDAAQCAEAIAKRPVLCKILPNLPSMLSCQRV